MQGHLQLQSSYNFLMQLFPLKSLVFVVHFLNAFWHGKETFPMSSSQNEIVPLVIVFHLPYSKYKDVKMFLLVSLQNQNFSLVSHLCRSCSTHVAFVSLVQHSVCTCVALALLVLYSCCIRVAYVALVSLVSGTRVVNQHRSKFRLIFAKCKLYIK